MTAFFIPTDICNRALQQAGGSRMDPILGFQEGSVNAAETLFTYDKVREAELQRRTWTFAVKETWLRAIDANTMRLDAAMWSAATTYFRGSIVSDEQGNLWESDIPDNLNNDPLLTQYWVPYFGPLAVPLYDSTGTTVYENGELVYTAAGDGTSRVYKSLTSSNSDVPSTATAWASTSTYFKDQVVTFNSVAYMSLIDLNINNEPDLAPSAWSSTTTYASGTKVAGSDGMIYQSSTNGNINHDPTTDDAVHWTNTGVLSPWTTSFTGGTGSLNWLEIGGTEFPNGVALIRRAPNYPVGSGPLQQTWTKNAYRLPAGFLRRAPKGQKIGTTWGGAPSGLQYDDWVIENGYLTSMDPGPIRLRFVANVTDVRMMHSMFCEGLAARVAFEIAPKITQSAAKRSELAQTYNRWMGEARTVNAIEQGWVESPNDDLITCRY